MTPCVRELRLVYSSRKRPGPLPHMSGPGSAAGILLARLENEPVEVCVVLLVNTKHRLLGIHELGRGTLDMCIVHPRDVFKAALLANAAGVIVAHNHPSGELQPSPEDLNLCARLRHAATILGIDLLDFVIVGDGRYYSFQEAGR